MKFLLKHTIKLLPAAIVMISTAAAQQKTSSFQAALTTSYKTVVPVKNKQNEAELKKATDKVAPTLQQALDNMCAATKSKLAKAAEESDRANKEILKTYPVKKTSIDLIADLSDAPFPITALMIAGKTDVDAMYKPYYQKLEQRKQQLTDLANKYNRYKEIHDKEGNAGLEKRAAAEADKNALVREMGGAENLKNMTEAERKAAAEKMKAKLQQNPSLLTGGSRDPGMAAMQQKLMSDPAYAKRFSNMSETEKQEEMKKYMTIKPQQGAATGTYTKSKEQTDAEKAIEVGQLFDRTTKRLEAATAIYNNMTIATTTIIDEMKTELGSWLGTTTQSIPMVELGEVGHDRDPELMNAMEITRKYAVYSIAKQEMELRAICWKQYKAAVAAAIQEFNNYADNYKYGEVSDDQLFNGTYNDQKIITGLAGYYSLLYGIANSSDAISSDSKKAQKSFEGNL